MNSSDWDAALSAFPDRKVYQTSAWLAFLAETQKGEIVIAALKSGSETLGYFSGLIVRKFGCKILGSPFRNWSTPYMGFNLFQGVSRRVALEALPEFAFKQLGCIHFEVVDPHVTAEDIAGLGFFHEVHGTVENDLTLDEAAILANMNSYRRRDIRRAEKNGLVIEEASDLEFADEFAKMFEDVFTKQGLVPNFGADRMRSAIKHLHPTGMLLLLRARNKEGVCVASGCFIGLHERAFYWAGASWRAYQNLHPNELLQWSAMRYWKQRGMKSYNFVGTMDFKLRFGGQQTSAIMVAQSKYALILYLRSSAPKLIKAGMRVVWWLKSLAHGKGAGCFS